jgi:mannose-6-phosphate isomerase-like protein (cupin superfamily)
LRDLGGEAVVVNIERLTEGNSNYRTALWTGKYLQVTLMSIPVGGEVGLEVHPATDQFLRIESGCALVQMGCNQNCLSEQRRATESDAICVPAGTWHNISNVGRVPLKLYSIYAPPHHPFGTVQATREDAEAEEQSGAPDEGFRSRPPRGCR